MFYISLNSYSFFLIFFLSLFYRCLFFFEKNAELIKWSNKSWTHPRLLSLPFVPYIRSINTSFGLYLQDTSSTWPLLFTCIVSLTSSPITQTQWLPCWSTKKPSLRAFALFISYNAFSPATHVAYSLASSETCSNTTPSEEPAWAFRLALCSTYPSLFYPRAPTTTWHITHVSVHLLSVSHTGM